MLVTRTVTHKELPSWLNAADAFVLPSMAEGSSNAVAEAMACGLPIITSDIPSMRELVPKIAAIFVPPTDVAALSAAIESVMQDSERRGAMGAAAVRAARNFTLSDRATLVAGWIEGIIASHSNR